MQLSRSRSFGALTWGAGKEKAFARLTPVSKAKGWRVFAQFRCSLCWRNSECRRREGDSVTQTHSSVLGNFSQGKVFVSDILGY